MTMTTKRISEMTDAEAAATLAALKRPKPEPMPVDKTAKEMTPEQRDAWLKEHKRRFS
jgi:ribosomal protein L29